MSGFGLNDRRMAVVYLAPFAADKADGHVMVRNVLDGLHAENIAQGTLYDFLANGTKRSTAFLLANRKTKISHNS